MASDIWRQILDFFRCFIRGIQNVVVTYCPLSGFMPPELQWQSCFWISRVSLTFLAKSLWTTATVLASSNLISPGQFWLCRATPDLSTSPFSTLVSCSLSLVLIFFLGLTTVRGDSTWAWDLVYTREAILWKFCLVFQWKNWAQIFTRLEGNIISGFLVHFS